MAGGAGSGDRACGHPAHPGTRFCPVCAEQATGGAALSQPATAPLPAVPAWPQSSPPPQPEPAPWDSWYAPRRPSPPPSGPQPWPGPPGPQPWSAPPGTVPPPQAGPDVTRADGLAPGDPPTAMLGDLRLAPASENPRRPRRPGRPLVLVIVAA